MHDSGRESGFTLLEMLVAMLLAGILMGASVWGMHSYLLASRESGTASDVQSTLRNAGERALSEGRTYCVYFTPSAWSMYKTSCAVAANKVSGPIAVRDASITLPAASTSFPTTAPCPTQGKCAYFYPRGTALKGSVLVQRPGKAYLICVESLTARVSTAAGGTCA